MSGMQPGLFVWPSGIDGAGGSASALPTSLRRPLRDGIVDVTPIGETDVPGTKERAVAPSRIMSPTFKSVGPEIRASFTKTPPLLPASSSVATPLVTDIRA
jgi:hypothetical protein